MTLEGAITRVFGSAARILFSALLVFTSFYSVLAYIPSTYIAFIQAPFQSWVPVLIRFQPYLYTGVVAAVCLSLWIERSADRVSRRLVIEFILAAALMSIYSFVARPFSALRNDSRSFVWAIAIIFPILWIGAIDFRTSWRRRDWSGDLAPRFSISLALLAALAIALVYPSAAYLRYKLAGLPFFQLHPVDLLIGAGAILAHILFLGFIVGLLAFSESVASRTRHPLKVRFALFTAVAWLAIAVVVERVAFGAIPFRGTESLVYSVLFGFAWAVFSGGLVLRAASVASGQPRYISQGNRRIEGALLALVLVSVLSRRSSGSSTGTLSWRGPGCSSSGSPRYSRSSE